MYKLFIQFRHIIKIYLVLIFTKWYLWGVAYGKSCFKEYM